MIGCRPAMSSGIGDADQIARSTEEEALLSPPQRVCLRWTVRVAVAALVLASLGGYAPAWAAPGPSVNEPVAAAFHAGELTLTGRGLGDPPVSRSIEFTYGQRSTVVEADSHLVRAWTDERVELDLPSQVQSGQLALTVGGVTSASIDLLVYRYSSVPVPSSAYTNDHPLAVALAPDSSLWFNSEYHRELKALSPDALPSNTVLTVPQTEGLGVFAHHPAFGDRRTRISAFGEDITVSDDGKVWFTQGGAPHYRGEYFNTSRVVQYDPAAEKFACFNAPIDNANVIGVVIDEPRGMIWYSEGIVSGNAITGFAPDSTPSDCSFDPYDEDRPRGDVCPQDGPTDSCHRRFTVPGPHPYPAHLALDEEGNIWFTEYWQNRIGRLTPETGEIVELPLPESIAREFPGSWFGSGPWELTFDEHGDLWVDEFFDATIVRVKPSLMASKDCERLDADGQNPCIEEMLVASDGADGKTLHTLSIGVEGLIWFAVGSGRDAPNTTRLGFLSPAYDYAVAYLPTERASSRLRASSRTAQATTSGSHSSSRGRSGASASLV